MEFFSYIVQIWGLVVDGMTRKKADRPWWSVIIPFYSAYVTFEMAGKKKLFWPYLVLAIISLLLLIVIMFSFIAFVVAQVPQMLEPGFDFRTFDYQSFIENMNWNAAIVLISALLLCSVLNLVASVFVIIALFSLSRAFGYEGAFGLGLFFFPAIFYSILAFGNHDYTDPNAPPAQPQQNNTYYANYNG